MRAALCLGAAACLLPPSLQAVTSEQILQMLAAHPRMADATSRFGCLVVQDYHFPAEEEEILKFWQVRTDWK